MRTFSFSKGFPNLQAQGSNNDSFGMRVQCPPTQP